MLSSHIITCLKHECGAAALFVSAKYSSHENKQGILGFKTGGSVKSGPPLTERAVIPPCLDKEDE